MLRDSLVVCRYSNEYMQDLCFSTYSLVGLYSV